MIKQVTIEDYLEDKSPNKILIDVREDYEVLAVSTHEGLHYPLSNFNVRKILEDLNLSATGDQEKTLYFLCKAGVRSDMAANMFYDQGYKNTANIQGGILDWMDKGYPLKD